MKKISGLLFGLFIAMVAALPSDLEEWNAFKLKYGKNYQSEAEDKTRMEIFLNNKHKIDAHNEKHNKGLVTYKMGLNKFSDLSPSEFNAKMKGFRPPSLLTSMHIENETVEYFHGSRHRHNHFNDYHDHHHHILKAQHLPASVDWRDEGAVNTGKRQGDCGSCWAFTTTTAIEGQYFRKNGKLLRLSEQNLIDCVSDCGCGGCSLSESYRYARDHGIDTADKYARSYIAEERSCQFDSSDAITIAGYKRIPEGDEQELQEAIATIGPISVSIDASHDSFAHYSSGVYYEPDCSSHDLDHGVLVVGYGTDDNGEDYYILKNWWSDDWGENGYLRLKRNSCNHCGVATNAMYPII